MVEKYLLGCGVWIGERCIFGGKYMYTTLWHKFPVLWMNMCHDVAHIRELSVSLIEQPQKEKQANGNHKDKKY